MRKVYQHRRWLATKTHRIATCIAWTVAYLILTILFGVELKNKQILRKLRSSFLIIANHQCVIDPFLLNLATMRQIQYIMSDSTLRSTAIRFLFSLVGVIPKTKNMPDFETIRSILKTKQAGGIIGLFPEGQSSWDGTTQPLNSATSKLIKLLRIPVIYAIINGSFLSLPRWGRGFRRGRIIIEYRYAFSPRDLKFLSADQIQQHLIQLLARSEYDFQRQAGIAYYGSRRAEYLEIVLFLCPNCRRLGTLHSRRNCLDCSACGYAVYYNVQGFFKPLRGSLHYDTLREWNRWQTDYFRRQLDEYRHSHQAEKNMRHVQHAGNIHNEPNASRSPSLVPTLPAPILSESSTHLRRGFKTRRLTMLCRGTLQLHSTCLRLIPHAESHSDGHVGDRQYEFQLSAIEGCNVQNGELLEFYYHNHLYQIRLASRRGNIYKWYVGIEHLRR